MPAKPISREYRIYLALWRKAFLHSETPLIIHASNFSMAVAMRQGMYRAIRPFRNGLLNDEELRQAADKYVIYLHKAGSKDSPHDLEFRQRLTLAELELSFDSLGLDEEDLAFGDERAALHSLQKFMETAPNEDKPLAVTPFYVREAD